MSRAGLSIHERKVRWMDYLSARAAGRRAIAAGAVLLAALMAPAPFAAGERSASARGTAHAGTRGTARARAAGTISLNESGRLHLTGKHGFTLSEQGPASGTVTGTIYVRLRIVSTSRVTAEVSIAPRGGSISGSATASYRRSNTAASFSGSLSISRGTGSFANARGSGLSFSGTIQRSNDAIAVRVSGRVSGAGAA
jgi:hypothetical protein